MKIEKEKTDKKKKEKNSRSEIKRATTEIHSYISRYKSRW